MGECKAKGGIFRYRKSRDGDVVMLLAATWTGYVARGGLGYMGGSLNTMLRSYGCAYATRTIGSFGRIHTS
jgi:hypothetical protein